MTTQVYEHAPIVEAVLDIRVRSSNSLPIEKLASVKDAQYPQLFQTPNVMSFTVSVDGASPTLETASEPLGFSYKSESGLQIFQVRKDGFSHNRLAPYLTWGPFAAEARRLWNTYKREVEPEEIEIVGLNYVNEIFMPFGADFEHYFNSFIEVPKELPQMLFSYTMSYQLLLPDDKGFLQLQQGYGPFKKEGHSTIALNIQAYKVLNKKIAEVSEDQLWSIFEDLREAKSRAFEACITDLVREGIR